MPIPNASSQIIAPREYQSLLNNIKQKVSKGTRAIALTKAVTYWGIGRDISNNLLKNKSRADYGTALFKRLAHDTKINERTLQQLVRFAREFSLPTAGVSFNWTQYRQLLRLKDKKARLALIRKARKRKWTTRELADEIKQGQGSWTLTPRKGGLYTYRLAEPPGVKVQAGYAVVDCGFGIWRQIPADGQVERLKSGDIVQSTASNDWFRLVASSSGEDDLYTYRAVCERVIDGDTILAQIDCGLRTWVRQYLRLRGINTPELKTENGERARIFVEDQLSDGGNILISTKRPDKYDRYLADVFVGKNHNTFLNQILLDKKLALPYNS